MRRLIRKRGSKGASMVKLVALSAVLLASCGSSQTSVTKINPTQGTVTIQTPASPTGAGSSKAQTVPTVFNCGGGAFKPETLLVACAKEATTVTGITWTSWSSTSATGRGTVHLYVKGKLVNAGAKLTLGGVKQTANGLQFSTVSLTWTGPSPDGPPTVSLALTVAPAP